MTASGQTAKAEAVAAALPLVEAPARTLAADLVEALGVLSVVGKDSTVDTGSYSYSYADIAAVVALTRPVLAAHRIVALTPIHDHGAGLACTVILLHTSGERLDLGPFPFPHGRDAQATGSMVTYHRRYALLAALGMATGDDDDGAAAQPAFVWTQAAVKAELVNLLGGDKAAAKEAWTNGGGDHLEPSRETAVRLAAEWNDNQPAGGELP